MVPSIRLIQGPGAYGQPVIHNGKFIVRGILEDVVETVLEYSTNCSEWNKLPPPPIHSFTIATLRDQLLVVGGEGKYRKSKTVFTFDKVSKQFPWVQSHPAMPTALTIPAVIGYQDHLIVAGGYNIENNTIPDVNILDTTSNKWKTAQPLPNTDEYCSVLIEDTMYLIGQDTQTVLRAHVPTLISGAKSGVWETLPNTPYYNSSPVTIGNTLLTVGGSDKAQGGKPTTSIHMYDPTTNQWTRVGDLPEFVYDPYCVIVNSELFVFPSGHVYEHEWATLL